jgi:uncharacterized membrane protein
MVGWGTPDRFFRLQPDLAPLVVLAVSLAVAFLLLRVRPTLVGTLLALLAGFGWLAAVRAVGMLLPTLLVLVLVGSIALARRRQDRGDGLSA